MEELRYEVNLLKVSVEAPASEIGERLEEIKLELFNEKHTETKPLPNPLVLLRQLMESAFDIADLEDLAFSLSVDLENIRGKTKRDLIVNLIMYFQRTEELKMLLAAAHEARPERGFGGFLEDGDD